MLAALDRSGPHSRCCHILLLYHCQRSPHVCVQDAKGAHRSGSEWAALAVLSYAAIAWTVYATAPNVLTGGLLGLAGAWIGLTVQHCGNHGAMSTNEYVNNAMGLCDDLVGGSSLMWRYHHQVCGFS